PVPGILAVEGLLKVEDMEEIVPGIGWLADQQPQIHQGKNEITDVCALVQAPVLQDQLGHYAVAREGEITAGLGKFAPGNAASLHQVGLTVLQGLEHEQVCTLVEPLLP